VSLHLLQKCLLLTLPSSHHCIHQFIIRFSLDILELVTGSVVSIRIAIWVWHNLVIGFINLDHLAILVRDWD